jgi:plastocyanin
MGDIMFKRAIATVLFLGAGIMLTSCGGGGSSVTGSATPTATAAPTVAADVVITINGVDGGMSFSPASAPVAAGQTVSWKNVDTLVHHVVDNGGAFDTGNIAAGTTSSPIKLSTAATFSYHCSIHPTMVGTLVVQ